MASPTVFRHAASLDDLVSIVSRYYSVPLAIREALLQGLRYDENLFVAVMTLMNQYHLDSMSFEVVKTILGKFSSDYFLRTLALIESENEELFHRLALVESLTFYSGVTPSEKNKALNELLKKISNQHVRAYLQETLESLKLGSDLAVSSIRK